MCLAPEKGLHLFFENHVANYNVEQEFKGKEVLGSGSFGEVRPVRFPSSYKYGPIVAKKIDVTNYLQQGGTQRVDEKVGKELEVGIILHYGDVGPLIIGCAFGGNNVYIVQQRLYGTLEDEDVQAAIKSRDIYIQISMWAEVFYREHYMWDLGYVHQDIKPANLMLSHDKTKIYLIDFGIVQEYENEYNTGSGTPWYKSFDKFYNRDLTVSSDIYATALSIAVFYSSENDIFSISAGKNKGQPLPDRCFIGTDFRVCLPHIVANIERVFRGSPFGSVTTPFNEENINFASLIYLSANYYNSPFNEDIFFHLLLALLNKEYVNGKGTSDSKPHPAHLLIADIVNQKERKFFVQDAIDMKKQLDAQAIGLQQAELDAYKALIEAKKRKDAEEKAQRELERQERLREEQRKQAELNRRIKEAMIIAEKKKQEEAEAFRQEQEQYRLQKARELEKVKSLAKLQTPLLEKKKSQANLFMSPSNKNMFMSPSHKNMLMSPSYAKFKDLVDLDREREDTHLISTPSHVNLHRKYYAPEKSKHDLGQHLPALKGVQSQAKLLEHRTPSQMEFISPSKKQLAMKDALATLKSKKRLVLQKAPVQIDEEEEVPPQKLPYIGGRIPDQILKKKHPDFEADKEVKKKLVFKKEDEDVANDTYGQRKKVDPKAAQAVYIQKDYLQRTREVNDNEGLINRRFQVAKDSVELYKHKDKAEERQKIYYNINKAAGYVKPDIPKGDFLSRVKSKKQFI